MKDLYRETGTIFRRSPLASPEGESFASRVRAVVADHARQLQGTLARAKREGGRFTQGTAGKKRTTLPGGVLVETWINPFGLVPTLMTKVYCNGGKREFDSSDILSGLVLVQDSFNPVITGELHDVFLRREEDSVSTYGPWEASPDLIMSFEYDEVTPCNSYIHWGPSMAGARGSQYSGKMRYVVQLLQGMNTPIRYGWQYCYTHGIFTNQNNGDLWVIEINMGDDIIAWKLPIRRKLTSHELELVNSAITVLPEVTFTPVAPVVLMDAADFVVATENAVALYSGMGWAFSYKGHEAQNINWVWSSSYIMMRRWKISISADENGEPASATLSKEEEVVMWYPRISEPKFPEMTTLGWTQVSFDAWNSVNIPPESGGRGAPIDVFYLRNSDDPVIVRDSIIGDSGTTVGTGNYLTDLYNTASNGSYTRPGGLPTESKVATRHFSHEGIGEPFNARQNYTDVGASIQTINWSLEHGNVSGLEYKTGVDIWPAVATEYWQLVQEFIPVKTSIQGYAEGWVKPFFDRESVVFHIATYKRNEYGTGYEFTQGAAGGNVYFIAAYDPPSNYVNVYPTTLCDPIFNTASLGSSLIADDGAYSPLGGAEIRYLPREECPAGQFPIMSWQVTGETLTGGYRIVSTTESRTEPVSAEIATWVLINGNWHEVYRSTEAVSGPDPFFETYELGDTFVFNVWTDVFSGGGYAFPLPNSFDKDTQVKIGRAGSYYPLNADPGDYMAWFGIPVGLEE